MANENPTTPPQPENKDVSNEQIQKIEKEIEKANPELLKGIPHEKWVDILKLISGSAGMIELMERKTIAHHGPLPHWEDLEKYNQIIPDGADRIMNMAERQQAHRMKLEEKTIGEQLSQSRLGQKFGLTIGIIAILVAGTCILMGHDVAGSAFGIAGITGLVSIFVLGKQRQRESLRNRKG